MAEEVLESNQSSMDVNPGDETRSLDLDQSNEVLDKTLREAFEKSDAPIDDVKDKPADSIKDDITPIKDPVKATEEKQSHQNIQDRNLIDPKDIKPPASLKNQENWKALRTNYDKAHSVVKKQDEEIKQLKSSLAEKSTNSNQEFEKLKKENEELIGYRRMLDAENDPEFLKNFQEPMNKLGTEMEELMKKSGIDENTIKEVDFTDSVLMDKIAFALKEHVDGFTSEKFRDLAREYLKKNDESGKFVIDYKTKYNEFRQKREKERFNSQAEESGRMIKATQQYLQNKDDKGNLQFQFLVKMETKPEASQSEIERASAHNKMVDAMHQRLDMVSKAQSPEDRAQVNIAAVYSSYLLPFVNYLTEKNKSLQAELGKISNISSEKKSGGQVAKSFRSNSENIDLEDSLSQAFPQFSK